MESVNFNLLKNISVTLIITGASLLFSCQDGTNKDDDDQNTELNTEQDTTRTGLEGTRDQAAQLSTDVNTDTTSGQKTSVGDKPGTGGLSTNTGNSSQNEQFVTDETAANYGEIKAATLAQQKSGNNEIKSIAGSVVKDHTSALSDLKSIGSKKGINLPTEENTDAKNKISGIENKNGSEFDKAWCEMMMEKHKITISKYESMVNSTSDQEVKNWINKVLPKIRIHHDKLMAVHGKIKS